MWTAIFLHCLQPAGFFDCSSAPSRRMFRYYFSAGGRSQQGVLALTDWTIIWFFFTLFFTAGVVKVSLGWPFSSRCSPDNLPLPLLFWSKNDNLISVNVVLFYILLMNSLPVKSWCSVLCIMPWWSCINNRESATPTRPP